MFVTKDMKLIYRNEREVSLEFSFFSSLALEKCEESLENDINSERQTVGHGETYISSRMEPRKIALAGFISGSTQVVENQSQQIIKVFNPTLQGKLIYIGPSGEKEIDCRVEETPFVSKKGGLFRFDIELTCYQPFWREKERTEYIALLIKNIAFPLTIPKTGIYFGLRKPILETKVQNLGDVESGFKVIFKATGGTVNGPKLFSKATGEYIKVNYDMQKGDIIEVINYPEKKKITINGTENGFKYLDIGSDFFNLDVGDNLIGYIADVNTINLDVLVSYTPRYLGVG